MNNVLVLVIDRLQTGFLGPYGNTWVATPHFDRVAAESFVFDNCLSATVDVSTACSAWWSGAHPLVLYKSKPAEGALVRRFAQAGMRTTLISDAACVLEHPLNECFEDVFGLGATEPAADGPSEDWTDTLAARSLSQVLDLLGGTSHAVFAWCHLASLGVAWGAPLAMRETYRAEDDPPCYPGTQVPQQQLPADYDPDELLPILHAYAAEVSLWDRCLEVVIAFLESHTHWRNTLLVVTAPRGFSLGEHNRVGHETRYYAESVHVPLLLRFPDGRYRGDRSLALAYTHDLLPTLLEFITDGPGRPSSESMPEAERLPAAPEGPAASLLPLVEHPFGRQSAPRDRLILGDQVPANFAVPWALRTPAWFATSRSDRDPGESVANTGDNAPSRSGQGGEIEDDLPPVELYVKPDDRWEQSDVADRCRDVAEAAAEEWQATLGRLHAGTPAAHVTPLPGPLRLPPR